VEVGLILVVIGIVIMVGGFGSKIVFPIPYVGTVSGGVGALITFVGALSMVGWP